MQIFLHQSVFHKGTFVMFLSFDWLTYFTQCIMLYTKYRIKFKSTGIT